MLLYSNLKTKTILPLKCATAVSLNIVSLSRVAHYLSKTNLENETQTVSKHNLLNISTRHGINRICIESFTFRHTG